jgi:hypothetical protein
MIKDHLTVVAKAIDICIFVPQRLMNRKEPDSLKHLDIFFLGGASLVVGMALSSSGDTLGAQAIGLALLVFGGWSAMQPLFVVGWNILVWLLGDHVDNLRCWYLDELATLRDSQKN